MPREEIYVCVYVGAKVEPGLKSRVGVCVVCIVRGTYCTVVGVVSNRYNFVQSCRKAKDKKQLIQVTRSKAPAEGAGGNWWHVTKLQTRWRVHVDEVLFKKYNI